MEGKERGSVPGKINKNSWKNVNISHSDENHPNSNFIRNEKGQGCIDGSRMKYHRSFLRGIWHQKSVTLYVKTFMNHPNKQSLNPFLSVIISRSHVKMSKAHLMRSAGQGRPRRTDRYERGHWWRNEGFGSYEGRRPERAQGTSLASTERSDSWAGINVCHMATGNGKGNRIKGENPWIP